MYYIGLDVHKKTISYCVKDVSGRIQQQGAIPATRTDLDSWVKTLPPPWTVAMEATIFNYMSNTGHSSYHSATVQFQKRYSQGLVLNSFYTLSKAIDDCDSDYGVCTGVAPVENRNLNKARAGYDRTHVFVTSATYELPVGRGRKWVNHSKLLDYLVGGYELAWIQSIESGNPFGVTLTNSPNNYYSTATGNQVPNLACSNISMPGFGLGDKIGGNRFNQALENPVLDVNCFSVPGAFTPGNAGRNIITGPGLLYSQASAKKNFALTERVNLQFRFDFQNPFHNYDLTIRRTPMTTRTHNCSARLPATKRQLRLPANL